MIHKSVGQWFFGIWLAMGTAALSLHGAQVGRFLLEEGAGTAAGDTSGYGNNADFSGDPQWVLGHGGDSAHALAFDGDDFLLVEDSASLDTITAAFSFSAWVNPDADSTHDTLIWKAGAFHVWRQNSNLMVTLDGTTGGTDLTVITGALVPGVWNHVIVIYDGQRVKSYLNGAWKRTLSPVTGAMSTSSEPLRIGWHNGAPFFRGGLDNVCVYNHALSTAERSADMLTDCLPDPTPLTVADGGVAYSAIVIPDSTPYEGVTYAAQELQTFVAQATGVTLGIYSESSVPSGYAGLIYVGNCQATAAAGIAGNYLVANNYVIGRVGSDVFLAGADGAGPATDVWTPAGSLFAVYEFLGEQLGVRWLWPGDTGIHVPACDIMVVGDCGRIVVRQLQHSRLRVSGVLFNESGWASATVRNDFLEAQQVWQRRHQIGRAVSLEYGHAFTDWYDLYGTTHPEYLNLLPDGTRRPDPHYEVVSMNVSSPALWEKIIDDWQAQGVDSTPWINGTENDTSGKCTDSSCMAWDVEPPDFEATYGCPWSQRLAYATAAFNGGDGEYNWYRYLGPLSDRYAKFWLALQNEAESRGHSDATVIGLAYANYKQPPVSMNGALNERIIVGIVPGVSFPWTPDTRADLHAQWDGWYNTGARLFLRPNYTSNGHNFPIDYAEALGEDFVYCHDRGMIASDFDSLTGQFASQGANLYMLARMHDIDAIPDDAPLAADVNGDDRVDLSDLAVVTAQWLDDTVDPCQGAVAGDIDGSGRVDLDDFVLLGSQWQMQRNDAVGKIIEEYLAAFGPASDAVRDYFAQWRSVSEQADPAPWATWMIGTDPRIAWPALADAVFTPAVMVQARLRMTAAQQAATGDADAAAKVAFLEKGLTHVELTLAAQQAWEGYVINGDRDGWITAIAALDVFRSTNEGAFISNMAFLYYWENRNWQRTISTIPVTAGTATVLAGDWTYSEPYGTSPAHFAYESYGDGKVITSDGHLYVLLDLGTPQAVGQIRYVNRVYSGSLNNADAVTIRVAPDESAPAFMPYAQSSYTQQVYSGAILPSTTAAGAVRSCDISDVTRRYVLLEFDSNFYGPICTDNRSVYVQDIQIVAP